TVAKLGGVAATIAMQRMHEWAAARNTTDPDEWSSDQWPSTVRAQADEFATQLRAHSLSPPVLYFIEWSDYWSMGDLFCRWLSPPVARPPVVVHADRFELYACAMADVGRHLAMVSRQQFAEDDQFVSALAFAANAWQGLADNAALIVLREVV